MNNEERFLAYRKNKILKIMIFIFSLAVIILEILALLNIIHFIWGLLVFIIVYFLKEKIIKKNK